jgi:hypothetical protein
MMALEYLKARFAERSTWAGFTAAVIGGSALATPFNWVVAGIGVVAVLAPTKGPGDA